MTMNVKLHWDWEMSMLNGIVNISSHNFSSKLPMHKKLHGTEVLNDNHLFTRCITVPKDLRYLSNKKLKRSVFCSLDENSKNLRANDASDANGANKPSTPADISAETGSSGAPTPTCLPLVRRIEEERLHSSRRAYDLKRDVSLLGYCIKLNLDLDHFAISQTKKMLRAFDKCYQIPSAEEFRKSVLQYAVARMTRQFENYECTAVMTVTMSVRSQKFDLVSLLIAMCYESNGNVENGETGSPISIKYIFVVGKNEGKDVLTHSLAEGVEELFALMESNVLSVNPDAMSDIQKCLSPMLLAANYIDPRFKGHSFANYQTLNDHVHTFLTKSRLGSAYTHLGKYIHDEEYFVPKLLEKNINKVEFWESVAMHFVSLSKFALQLVLLPAGIPKLFLTDIDDTMDHLRLKNNDNTLRLIASILMEE
ncbi:hypothetical protein QAD02_020566 [Eretmocerus hayati]|uniref:Uncharacterized protein n=1 Tax=Eretmocerus hayati TaxID=131215 RepID=A0ACC2PMU8_9HYME|nr:hypothetical protein QAD02_020566 [Eretmocerus hayati]